ncbi:ATP-binding protein [Micromonospora sp. LOL_024]|uniref:ATP-binding protein n=1 Tax=Micromonospora sp. LOL_024 TaxID=3345412 RepID=UPI003A84CC77
MLVNLVLAGAVSWFDLIGEQQHAKRKQFMAELGAANCQLAEAAASRGGVTLSYMSDVVTLNVRDDGAGLDATGGAAAPNPDGGYGLTAMRQRVTRVGGQLAVESEPGGGTAISASVPALPGGAG